MAESSTVAVIVKVVPLVVEVDPVDGVPTIDLKMLGVSAADRAALAVGQLLALEVGATLDVLSVTAPMGAHVLHALSASCPGRFTRISLAGDEELVPAKWSGAYPSSLVARVLSTVLSDATFIVAGEHSLDRGSATVPARIAQRLGCAQALGLLKVDVARRQARRRLDGGWIEELSFGERTVLSVEASAGHLARAGLAALRSAEVRTVRVNDAVARDSEQFAPYRAPVDVVRAPREAVAARRAMEVIGALSPERRREVVTTTPVEAAAIILERLSSWGYR